MKLFKENSRVCVEFGQSCIKILAIRRRKKDYEIVFFDYVDLLKSYSLLSAMEVNDDHFIEQLKNLKDIYQIQNRDISLVIPASSTVLHSFEIDSSLDSWEMNEVIQEEIEQVLTEGIKDLRIVCHNTSFNPESHKQSVIACGISNNDVERYLSIFERSGLNLTMITVDAIELYNAHQIFTDEETQEPATILFSGDKHIICLITQPNAYPFIHTFPLSDDDLEDPLQTIEIIEEESLEQAEAKESFSDLGFVHLKRRKDTLTKEKRYPVADKIYAEIKKCQNHVKTCKGLESLGDIVLTGWIAGEPELVTAISKKTTEKVKLWNPFDVLLNTPDDNIMGFEFATTLGTSIRVD